MCTKNFDLNEWDKDSKLIVKEGKTMNKCPFCSLKLEKETTYYEDACFIVLKTKDLKGHKDCIMIVLKEHTHTLQPLAYERALDILVDIGKRVFDYTPKFVVMDSTWATVKEHWHLVCCDLDPKADDFEQVLRTTWIIVVDTTCSEPIRIKGNNDD